MSKRVAVTTLNASTADILNVIRTNANEEYQKLVPKVEKETDIPKVGEVLYGYPSMANQFISALVNRIALVKVNSATFNNAYKNLKKGYLEFGETVEEVFVNIARVRVFNAEKAEANELKRSLPDVKTAMHIMNWRVQYPVTIQNEDLRMAFTSYRGVEDLIARIVDSVYTASEYDEFLLTKYLLIKAIASGKVKGVSVTEDMTENASAFRGISNRLTLMSKDYNESGVRTSTPRDRQVIFMSSKYNARYDVEVLASAFNMDKADFMGRLYIIDDWETFDNERFESLYSETDGIEPVSEDELEVMKNVKAVLADSDWFQIYDNLSQFTEKYVSSGLYWNYFYNTWKTISHSPFSNIVVFTSEEETEPNSLTLVVTGKSVSEEAIVYTLELAEEDKTAYGSGTTFVQTKELTEKGIGVHPYGAYLIPSSATGAEITLKAEYKGHEYVASDKLTSASKIGDVFTLS